MNEQHQYQQPQPHGSPRQQDAGGQQSLQPALLLVEAGKLQGEGGGGGQSRQYAGEHQPGAGAEQPHREVATKRDAGDHHHHQPDLEGVEGIEGPHLLVGQHRQQHQRDKQKTQGGVELCFAQKQHPLLDLPLQAHQQGGQHGAGDRFARAQQHRHQPQQIGEQHGYRAGEAELPLPALGQPDREAAADHHRQQAEQRQPGAQGGQQQTAHPAKQADEAVGPHPRDALVIPQLAHLPAALQSDNQADGQRDQGSVDGFCIDPHNDFLFVICLPCSDDGTALEVTEGHGSQSLRPAPGAGG